MNQQDDSNVQLMTVAEAASIVGVSPSFIYREASARRIAVYRLGGRIRIAASELAEYLERHHQSSVGVVTPKRKHF